MTYVLAIDQGTTSTRAMIFDAALRVVAVAQEEFDQHFPRSGWVEHDAVDLWTSTAATCRGVIEKAGIAATEIAAIGITNQRETTLIWDRKTGKPIHKAIVWQDRRTSDLCRRLREEGHEATVTDRTGLLLDPYFSATKVRWLLDNVDGARARAEAGELAFGTVDSWLVWNLTGGRAHVTDATNAARTMLYDIRKGRWSRTLCEMLDIPMSLLPEVRDCASDFGTTRPDLFGREIPILGIAGDQQAATVGQACFQPGMMKSTYGTGCFALLNTGDTAVTSQNRLLTTIAYQFEGKPTYALEGSIFIAGAVVQWLRDGLQIIDNAPEVEDLARSVPDSAGVVFVPALTGLGAPEWDPRARGLIVGITRGTTRAHIARATLEAIAYEVRDVVDLMSEEGGVELERLAIDGGAAANDLLCQMQADQLRIPVDRSAELQTTGIGAAFLAGLGVGMWKDIAELQHTRTSSGVFEPHDVSDDGYQRWRRAVERSKGWAESD